LNEGPAVDGFIQTFRDGNILTTGETGELFTRLRQVTAVYPREDVDLVSSHNDMFKPDNILFDGRRVWLVDWEAAFLNDRYTDLAVVANLVVTNDAEEGIYLREYFGEAPDEYQRARFFLMQQLAHMFYAVAYLGMGAAGGPVDWSERAPEFNDFHRRFWDGEAELTDQPPKLAYGKVHWNRLAKNMRQARFDEALRIVSDRHAGG
jgi:thiamine kinase-like enzyme